MDLQHAIDSIWNALQHGDRAPAEWKGRLGLADAYRVQLGLLDRHVAAGHHHAGWKVGLTAKAIQEQEGFHEPVFGYLLEQGHWPSGAVRAASELTAPGFENELCLTLGSALEGPGVTTEQARTALSHAAPALEIVERRGPGLAEDAGLAIVDDLSQRAFVTGSDIPLEPGLSLAATTLHVVRNGEALDRADGSAVLGDPAASVAWLANKLAEFGRRLEPGQRIMSGSFTRLYLLEPGDRVESRFEPFGTVTFALT